MTKEQSSQAKPANKRPKAPADGAVSARESVPAESLTGRLEELPEHATSRPLVQSRLVQLQKQLGNRHVVRNVLRATPRAQGSVPAAKRFRQIQRTQQQRESRGGSWYIEIEPASSVVPLNSLIRFRLKNDTDTMIGTWSATGPDQRELPLMRIERQGGEAVVGYPRRRNYPVTVSHRFEETGHYEITFEGTPHSSAGPGASLQGRPIRVSVELDVVEHMTQATMEDEARQETVREDINRIEDPNASEPEIAQAFERVAVRRAIEVVNRNKREALDMLRLYTRGNGQRSAAEARHELAEVIRFDEALQEERRRIANRADEEDIDYQTTEGETYSTPEMERATEKIDLVRASLVDAFPALGLRRREQSPAPETWIRQQLPEKLRLVMRDCDRTRVALATGDLSIFEVSTVVDEVRQSLGVDRDPRKRRAIDGAIARHEEAQASRMLGLAGASLTLLMVPGLGPFLAAAVGIASAGIAWEHAGDLQTASRAGIAGGIVSSSEANAAAFWAIVETLLAGLEVANAVRPLLRLAPHVPAAADRLVPRASRAMAGDAAEHLAPRAASGALDAEHPLRLTAAELDTMVRRLFGNTRSLRGRTHVYGSWADYALEFRRHWPAPMPIPRGGYFNPLTETIHVSPSGNLLTALHEAVHDIAHEAFPMGRQILGDFLDEGITEMITRSRFGPHTGRHGYDVQVRFAQMLSERLGQDVVENALLRGNYEDLHWGLHRMFRFDGERLAEFFRHVRAIGSSAEGSVGNARALRRAVEMLTEAAG